MKRYATQQDWRALNLGSVARSLELPTPKQEQIKEQGEFALESSTPLLRLSEINDAESLFSEESVEIFWYPAIGEQQ